MIQHFFKYSLLIAIIFAFASCDKQIYDTHGEDDLSQPAVFLSVSYNSASHTRAQSDNASINEDDVDREDRVHDLALLVFDTTTGEKVAEHFAENIPSDKTSQFFVIKLIPGQRDFYFVANMPMGDLNAITKKSEMEAYMDKLHTLDDALYAKATKTKGFPMSRTYIYQEITEGGTVYQPKPYLPVGATGPEDRVYLIRAVAKLEVKIADDELSSVQSITLKNAVNYYNLVEIQPSILDFSKPETYHGDIALNHVEGTNSYLCYMPESIMQQPSWVDGAANQNKPIHYFEVVTTSGSVYDIPIISHIDKDFGWDDGYLEYAKKPALNNKLKYNIYRNRWYKFELRNLTNIEVKYSIKDWQKETTSLYMGYGYNVYVDKDGKVHIENTVLACDPHNIRLVALNGAKFSDDNSTEKIFTDSSTTAKVDYQIDFSEHTGGNYLQIYYNEKLGGDFVNPVKTFSK